MKIVIYGKPSFHLALSRADVEVLYLLASNHYDLTCTALSMEGGTLHTILRVLNMTEQGEYRCVFAWCDMDLLCKVLEERHRRFFPQNVLNERERAQLARADALAGAFIKAIHAASTTSVQSWQMEIDV